MKRPNTLFLIIIKNQYKWFYIILACKIYISKFKRPNTINEKLLCNF